MYDIMIFLQLGLSQVDELLRRCLSHRVSLEKQITDSFIDFAFHVRTRFSRTFVETSNQSLVQLLIF